MKSKDQILGEFALRLRKFREAQKLSQMDLAVKVDSSPSYISRLETGRSEPGLYILSKLTKGLNVTLKDLTGV